jgi:hypothetical protein
MKNIQYAVLGILFSFPITAWSAIHVELKVNNAGDALEIEGNDQPCPGASGSSDLTCIEVKKGQSPNIIFHLDDACDADVAGHPEYMLHADSIRITMIEKVWPTGADKLPVLVADDFEADRNSGVIDLGAAGNSFASDRIKFKNKNSHAYSVYYEINAQKCADPSQSIVLDPIIRNPGH